MERQVLKNTIYSHIKDLSDFEKSKIDKYKIIKLDFGDAVCDFVKKAVSVRFREDAKIRKCNQTYVRHLRLRYVRYL